MAKKTSIVIGIAPVIFFLLVFQATAQFGLTGRITGGNKQTPLPGAHITLVSDTSITAIAGTDGYYRVTNLVKGDYRITVSHVGYKTLEQYLFVNRNIELGFILERAEVMENEFVVTATRVSERSPAAFTNLEKRDIERNNQGKDLPFLLESAPSVVTTSDAGAGVGYTNMRIRGTDLTRINVTLNGVPLNDAESHGVWFVDLPDMASAVDNIQIQRGVGTSSNGAAAFGASINIQTSKPEPDPYGEINLTGGSFNTFRRSMKFGSGHINSRWSFDGIVSAISSDGYIDRASSELSSVFLSGAYIGKKSIIKANLFKGKEKTYQAWMGIPRATLDTNRTYNPMGLYTHPNGNITYYDNQTDNYLQDHYHGIINHTFGENLLFNATIFYVKGSGYYEEYHDKSNPYHTTSFSAYGLNDLVYGEDTVTAASLVRQLWMDNDFYGLVYSFSYNSPQNIEFVFGGGLNEYTGLHFGKIIWTEFAGNADINHKWYENTGIKKDMNLFGKASVPLSEKWFAFGDIQFRRIGYRLKGLDKDFRDLTQQHIYTFFNPKVGLTVLPTDRQKTYLAIGISNREPNRYNFIDTEPGRPLPSHETLYDLEAGYRYAFRNTSIGVNLYYMLYRDQLVLTGRINDVGSPVMENVPESYRTGIELTAAAKLLKNFEWAGNATLSENRIRNYTGYVVDFDAWPFRYDTAIFTNTHIAFSPGVTINSELSWKPLSYLRLNLISKYVGKQYMDNTSSEARMLNDWHTHDVLLNYMQKTNLFRSLEISLRFCNILNHLYESNAWVYRYYSGGEYYEDAGFFPQAGLHLLAGLKLSF